MRTEIRFRGIRRSEPLRLFALRLVEAHLRRFGRAVSEVVVRIGDTNGPRGGVDKYCRITVRGPGLGSETLAELSSDAYAAVDLGIGRAERAVGRRLARARAMRTGGAPPPVGDRLPELWRAGG